METRSFPQVSPPVVQYLAAFLVACEENSWEEADRGVQEILEIASYESAGLLALSDAITNAKRAPQAIPAIQLKLRDNPDSAPLHECLANLLRATGNLQGALHHARLAVSIDSNSPIANGTLGLCLLKQGATEKAVGFLKKATGLASDLAFFHNNLAIALLRLKRFPEAAASFRRVIELTPDSANSYWLLADTLKGAGQLGEAIAVVEQGVNVAPSPDAYFRLACFLGEDRQYAESEIWLRKTIEVDPNHVKAHEAIGLRLQQFGRFDEAAESFRRVIELDPERPDPYHWLIRDRRVTESDRDLIERVEEMLAQPGRSPEQIRQLSYALGKAYEDLGDFGKAMAHFDEANKQSLHVQLQDRRYPHEEHKLLTERLIKAFTEDFLNSDPGIGAPDERPVFIVGMMRSGTTLAEQILSSHPKIAAGGEILFWTRPDIAQATGGLCLQKIDKAVLRMVANMYSKILTNHGGDSPRVTDKMPLNFGMLGAIRILFPKAKVIHCKRHPVDTCLSLYTTPLHGANFLFDRGNIVFAYKEYLRLMAHWREVLPEDFILEVEYEKTVTDREAVVRRMLEFIGVEWNEACMTHENNTREVTTPSRWQARQPIYSSSVERWRKFEPWLREFRELL